VVGSAKDLASDIGVAVDTYIERMQAILDNGPEYVNTRRIDTKSLFRCEIMGATDLYCKANYVKKRELEDLQECFNDRIAWKNEQLLAMASVINAQKIALVGLRSELPHDHVQYIERPVYPPEEDGVLTELDIMKGLPDAIGMGEMSEDALKRSLAKQERCSAPDECGFINFDVSSFIDTDDTDETDPGSSAAPLNDRYAYNEEVEEATIMCAEDPHLYPCPNDHSMTVVMFRADENVVIYKRKDMSVVDALNRVVQFKPIVNADFTLSWRAHIYDFGTPRFETKRAAILALIEHIAFIDHAPDGTTFVDEDASHDA
jgi:hypothetical protein